jgi:hypothetical protein
MILKPYATALGAVDDSNGDDSGSTLGGIASVLNSGAATGLVSGFFSLFGVKPKTSSSSSAPLDQLRNSGTSPLLYVAGAGVAIVGLALILRKRR